MGSQYARDYRSLQTIDFEKNVKAKKCLLSSSINHTSGQSTQPNQSTLQLNKKNFRLR